MTSRTHGQPPATLGLHQVSCSEMMAFQYLPIKLAEQTAVTREERLKPFDGLIGAACCDFIGAFGLDRFVHSYVYLTAKHLIQGPGATFNRLGWHCDGFMTDDVNYIWCDKTPTIFNLSKFSLSQDDRLSMLEMDAQADPEHDLTSEPGALLRINQFCIHRVQQPTAVELRTFFKLSISGDRYDLEGNSRNYLLGYGWAMRPRSMERNVPQRLSDVAGRE